MPTKLIIILTILLFSTAESSKAQLYAERDSAGNVVYWAEVEKIDSDTKNLQESKPAVALKSNLLLDAASLVNLSLEFPLGNRFSLAAEGYFPWWKLKQHDITIQLMAATLETRCWMGNRKKWGRLTGFFTGLYAGAGYYDFQLGGDGAQGEMFIMGGLSVGFAHRISRHFHLEYTLGVGYLQTDYREYYPAKGTEHGDVKARKYPWETKRFSGILPTKAAVSLVWTLGNHKKGRRGYE